MMKHLSYTDLFKIPYTQDKAYCQMVMQTKEKLKFCVESAKGYDIKYPIDLAVWMFKGCCDMLRTYGYETGTGYVTTSEEYKIIDYVYQIFERRKQVQL